MDHSFSFITSLQYQLKAALAQLAAFQSGKKIPGYAGGTPQRGSFLKTKGKTDAERTGANSPGYGSYS